MPALLVIDDDPAILHVFRRAFSDASLTLLTAESAAEGLALVADESVDVVVLDVVLPDQSGLDVFRRLKDTAPKTPVIFITASSTSDTAIEAMKLGAFEYLLKPLDLARIDEVVSKALEIRRFMAEPVAIAEESSDQDSGDVLVGSCAPMQEVYKAVGRVAGQDVTVLIRGESGTGKELVARAVYQHSHRAEGPFLAINCAAIPEPLLESELFGHEKGAFTNADRTRIGKFEQCSGGTLFLDEIGDMAPTLQSKLLRVLQEQRFERVGGSRMIETDVRLVAATNRNLEEMVADKEFREDLLYRLNAYTVHLPPLRARSGDLSPLIQHFVKQISRELGKDVRSISPEAEAILEAYDWPGNVRELQNMLRKAILESAGPILLADFLPQVLRSGQQREVSADERSDGWSAFVDRRVAEGTESLYEDALLEMERRVISRILEHTTGNQNQAAKFLGIARGTLRSKIRNLGINIERVISQKDSSGNSGE